MFYSLKMLQHLRNAHPIWSSSIVSIVIQCRPFYPSAHQQRGIYPYFNKHKPVTDPKQQDPDYFEKKAEKVPINSRYINELKKIWEEKIGSERELIFKASDRLVGIRNVRSSEEFGLPKLDMSKPRLDWVGIDALEGAPPEVKKIYSLEHGSGGDISAAWKLEMMKKVRFDELDGKSLPAKIAWATAIIRNWSQVYARNEVARKRLKYGRMRPRATWISQPLYLMINHRRKLLRLLRQSSEEDFQRVIAELKIAFHVEKERDHVKTRKAWSEAQLKRRIVLEKERQLAELHQKMMEGREERTKQIDEEMASIEVEERQIFARLHQLDIIEGKTVANVAGKYIPNYVGEFKEIAENGRFFF